MSTKSRIIAVGCEIDFSNLRPILDKELPENKIENTKITAGVWYSTTAKGPTDCHKSDTDLQKWFNQRKPQKGKEFDDNAYISKIYISKNNRLVIGEVVYKSERLYAFFYNENNVPTTLIKKEVNRGDDFYRVVEFEKVTMKCRPYIHCIVNRQPVIQYD